MIPRQPLRPNNRSIRQLNKEMKSGVVRAKQPKSNERPSILGHLRHGRQNSEGFGGGSRII